LEGDGTKMCKEPLKCKHAFSREKGVDFLSPSPYIPTLVPVFHIFIKEHINWIYLQNDRTLSPRITGLI
jgi:hypothetical protein